jgi:hypothetical protein
MQMLAFFLKALTATLVQPVDDPVNELLVSFQGREIPALAQQQGLFYAAF